MKVVNKINTQELLNSIQQRQMKKDVPDFGPGDIVSVWNRIKEGNKSRIQKFEGIVMRRKGSGLSESFLVRKESNGVYVERNFLIHSPLIEKIEVLRKGKVRRAYITYMRQRHGKSARIKEKR